MKTNKLWLAGGLLAGAAAGVVIGVLFAPDKGSSTRKKILDKGEDCLDKMNKLLDDATGKLEAIKETIAQGACACGNNCNCNENKPVQETTTT